MINWQLTAWQMNGNGGWTQQPVITIEGQVPFFADHPDDYIAKLQELHDSPQYTRGPFYGLSGALKDGLDQVWNLKETP